MRSGIGSVAICLCVLLSSACGRLGFEILHQQAHKPTKMKMKDGGQPSGDAGSADASVAFDAALAMDASAALDASVVDANMPADAGNEDDSGSAPAHVCPPPSGTSYCTDLPHLTHKPAIDGVLEPCLTLEPIVPMLWTSVTPQPALSNSRYAAAWLPSGLYVYIDVDDPSRLPAISSMPVWCGDGVEVYVDDDGTYAASPKYDNPGTAQLIIAAPETDLVTGTRSERYRDAMLQSTGVVAQKLATFPRRGGYVLEGVVTAPDLDLGTWTLHAGAKVGLDIGVNVSPSAEPTPTGETTDCGRRMGQYFMSVPAGCTGSGCDPFFSVPAFCTPQLH